MVIYHVYCKSCVFMCPCLWRALAKILSGGWRMRGNVSSLFWCFTKASIKIVTCACVCVCVCVPACVCVCVCVCTRTEMSYAYRTKEKESHHSLPQMIHRQVQVFTLLVLLVVHVGLVLMIIIYLGMPLMWS